MPDPKSPREAKPAGVKKDPDDWTTGDEPMTSAQASYPRTLCDKAGEAEAFDPDRSKAEASKRIDALRNRTGRGGSRSG